jgi:hypothetical protein
MNSLNPKIDIQKCGCSSSSDCLGFDKKTRTGDDQCYIDYETVQSVSQGAYTLQNFRSCECGAPGPKSVAFSQPNVNFQVPQGWSGENGCLIDNDSILRYEHKLTNLNTINTLYERPYLTVPYMGRGVPHPNEESALQPGESTTMKRSCNTLAGVSIENFFTPLVDNLRNNVQNTKHIIPEDSSESWVRGGLSSRAMVRNFDYIQRCG